MAVAPNDFTHLHVHSEFSLLDGLGRITELVDDAKSHGFDSLAITDHGALYGAVAFYQACKTAGIKPIIGVETYVARRSMTDREGKADSQPYHLILLAKDWTGYQNLCRIVTDAHLDGYYKPRIDREYLAQHSAGLVGLSACLNGEVPRANEFGALSTDSSRPRANGACHENAPAPARRAAPGEHGRATAARCARRAYEVPAQRDWPFSAICTTSLRASLSHSGAGGGLVIQRCRSGDDIPELEGPGGGRVGFADRPGRPHIWRFESGGHADHGRQHPHFICEDCGSVSCLSDSR